MDEATLRKDAPETGGQALAAEPAAMPTPELVCYRLEANPPPLVPARSARAWMDETPDRFAYRCTPLSIANASGWEILSPCSFQAFWNGGARPQDIAIASEENPATLSRLVVSHFGSGVLTFHTGYLFRTPPGWAVWARGTPNTVEDGIVPLDGLVETDWLPFTFTMNWRFTRRKTIRFEKGEPFCFVTLFPHGMIDEVAPRLADLADDPPLKAEHEAWSAGRAAFNEGLAKREPAIVAEGWQRRYLRGEAPDATASTFHRHKRRLKPPKTHSP